MQDQCIRLLIDGGADLTVCDENGKDALSHARNNNDEEVVQMLLEALGSSKHPKETEGGDDSFEKLPIITDSLTEGDRVRALKDSPYTKWRKAGATGTVNSVDGEGAILYVEWDGHEGNSTMVS